MTQLSDTQAIILSAAAQRPEHIALPLPESLRGGAAAKVVGTMIAKGLLQEVEVNVRRGEPVWRETGDGHGTTLVATDAGLAAIPAPLVPDPETEAAVAAAEATWANDGAKDATKESKPRTRESSKQAEVIRMLQRPEGATIAQICEATGWQAHTVRGTFAGALKKKLGLTITSDKVKGAERVYRVA